MPFIFITAELITLVVLFDSALPAVILRPPWPRDLHYITPEEEAGTTVFEPALMLVPLIATTAKTTTSNQAERAVNVGGGGIDCFITGCVPYSYTAKAHGCGVDYVLHSKEKCASGYTYECCQVPAPAALTAVRVTRNPAPNEVDSENSAEINFETEPTTKSGSEHEHAYTYWNPYKTKNTIRRTLCMFGRLPEIFC